MCAVTYLLTCVVMSGEADALHVHAHIISPVLVESILEGIRKMVWLPILALESVSILASALSTALTIYPCQIRVHQR